jgi:hypothetical protein
MKQIYSENSEAPSSPYMPVASGIDERAERQTDAAALTEKEEVTAIAADVSQKVKQYQRTISRTVMSLMTFMLGVTLFMQFVIRTGNAAFWTMFPTIIMTILALMGGVGLLLWRMRGDDARALRKKADRLASGKDKTAIGTLIEMFAFEDVQTHRKVKQGLTNLLPTLTASDSHLLGRAHRAKLNRILSIRVDDPGHKDLSELFTRTTKREVDLRLAILKAFEQVGDETSLRVVDALATRTPLYGGIPLAEGDRLIQAAAKECLAFLRVRVEQQSAQKSLLRASSAASLPDNTLLRPAASSASCSDSLLRPDPSVPS